MDPDESLYQQRIRLIGGHKLWPLVFGALETGSRKQMTESESVPVEVVMSKIYAIRNHKVMLDIDLAELYQLETGRLNEQVKRNAGRFPEDFMVQPGASTPLRSMEPTSSSHDPKPPPAPTKSKPGNNGRRPTTQKDFHSTDFVDHRSAPACW